MAEPLTDKLSQAPEITTDIFGGVLVYDAAGHYPGLELLNLVFNTKADTLLPDTDSIKIQRRAHDFARKVVWDENFIDDPRRADVLLNDQHAEDSIRELLLCLQLDIPSGATSPSWSRAHFFPYTKSLIHWDARDRRNGVSLERVYLRGGGALAHKILRQDHNNCRLQRIRAGFNQLYLPTEDTPLEALAEFLSLQGTIDNNLFLDEIEHQSKANIDAFEDCYREGILNILEQQNITTVAKLKAVMSWTGIWLVLMQNQRANNRLGKSPLPIICDCGSGNSQLRREAQRCLQDIQVAIMSAATKGNPNLANKQRNNIRSFFWATAAANGLLNAWKGRKHFTLSISTLEMIVLSRIQPGHAVPFESFVHNILFEELGLVVGRKAAEKIGLVNKIDASIFEENENQLANQMIAAGLVTQFSDATRMVNPGSAS